MAKRAPAPVEEDSELSTERSAIVHHVGNYTPKKIPSKQRSDYFVFLAELYAKIPTDELSASPLERLRARAESFWTFAEKRPTENGENPKKLRVYNPESSDQPWDCPHTIIELVCNDMPFLVASLLAELNERDFTINFLAHPIVNVVRNHEGTRTHIEPAAKAMPLAGETVRESMIHVEISERLTDAECRELHDEITHILFHVSLAVHDWKAMDARLRGTIKEMGLSASHVPSDEHTEAVEFLKWLCDNHFLFFGARDYAFEGDPATGQLVAVEGTSLGVLNDPDVTVLRNRDDNVDPLSPEVRKFLQEPTPIITTKSNYRSRIHRNVYMDYIGVKLFGTDGRLIGERRFVGLFTAAAYNRSTHEIPLIRRKVQLIVGRSELDLGSHDETALLNIIENFPRDELFQADIETLEKICNGIVRLNERPRTKLFVRRDQFDRFISAMVFFPRERFTSAMRNQVGEILVENYGGRVSAFYTQFGDTPLARVHYILGRIDHQKKPSTSSVEKQVVNSVRSWHERLSNRLRADLGEGTGALFAREYVGAFTEAYKEAFDAEAAAIDIAIVEKLTDEEPIAVRLYQEPGDDAYAVRLKLYQSGSAMTLTQSMPMLENLGLNVIYEFAYDIHPVKKNNGVADRKTYWVHDFYAELHTKEVVDMATLRICAEPALLAITKGEAENDGFNHLILSPGFHWRDVAILRACAKYRQQAGSSFSQAYIEEAIAQNPGLAGKLIELFKLRFEPDLPGDIKARTEAADEIRAAILHGLKIVESLDQDRIIRRMLNLIDAMVRTNFFQVDENGNCKDYISFKFNARQIDELPEPKPYAEIFVYSPQVEGVHLRGGPIARGGLRWSDRREDFRTEVLGLVKAQQVKNAVIVPVGAKGGFFPKHLPVNGTREETREEAVSAYKTFISGLLDITDNLPLAGSSEDIIQPDDVICHDGPDPYLVVAADKGTADFSDIANGLAQDYGFWLGDAFASGGSVGYDHKAMGITARGAWEAVKRHFRELGTDIQTEPFSVVGVGDMSGDVFGNGMLLSKAIKLIAAFDHRHIFIDPDPDPETTWQERSRLFEVSRSSWDDYNKTLISEGGGIFSRAAKEITLTPEIKALFEMEDDVVTPNELIGKILRGNADLLWFGGIGTYIKAKDETNLDVGDHANDTIRVNASELRIKVIGEGANLGCTQRGRIDFARAGGKVNMDAVDNAAGVDCSDHEVNIKILVDSALASGQLKADERIDLLASMTDDVSALVLKNNYAQTLSLTVTELTAVTDRDAHGRLMRALERNGRLNREIEFLPDEECLQQLAETDQGLSRPELAILMSYTKIAIFDSLLASTIPDDPYFNHCLEIYFPPVLQERYRDLIKQHRLRREIISTELVNEMIHIGGITFVHRLNEISGASPANIAHAYAIAAELLDIKKVRGEINALDNKIPAHTQTLMHHDIQTAVRSLVTWFLRQGPGGSIAELVEKYRDGVREIDSAPRSILSSFSAQAINDSVKHYIDQGVSETLATRVATLTPLCAACDLMDLAGQCGLPLLETAEAYFQLGSELRLDRLVDRANTLSAGEHWDRLAIKRISGDFVNYQRAVSQMSLQPIPEQPDAGATARLETWLTAKEPELNVFRHFLGELEAAGGLTIAKLSLVNSQLRDLVHNLQAQ